MNSGLELSAWRLLYETPDLSSYVGRLFPLLWKELPSSFLMVRRLDPERRRLETCASADSGLGGATFPGVSEFSERDCEDFLSWSLSGDLIGGSAGDDGWESGLTPPGFRGHFIAGPLRVAAKPAGIAMLLDPADYTGRTSAVDIFGPLIRPLSAALERDLRRHDVSRLSEAAEAGQRAEILPRDIAESIVAAETGLRGAMENVERLKTALGLARSPKIGPRARGPAIPSGPAGTLPTLDEAMRGHIESALASAGGRIEGPNGAARLLDINPHTLRARMRVLGVDWRRFRRPRVPAPDR